MNDNMLKIFNDIQKIVDNNGSLQYAVSVVSKKYGLNPHYLYNKYFKDVDIENGEQIVDYSNVELKNDKSNTENEITSNMENDMNKLNEAQYNLSIEGLSTEDAATLSQMLSLANQAETSSNPMEDDFGTDIASPMGDENIDFTEPGIEDDVPFDDEISADEYEIVSTEAEEPVFDDMDFENLGEDLLLDKSEADPTFVANETEEDFDDSIELNEGEVIPFDETESKKSKIKRVYPKEMVLDNIANDVRNGKTEGKSSPRWKVYVQKNGIEDEIVMPYIASLIKLGQMKGSDPMWKLWIYDEIQESEESFDTSVRDNVVEELFDLISEYKGEDYLSDEEYDRDELLDCIKDFGNEIDGFDIKLVNWYADALRQKYQDKEDFDTTDETDDFEDVEESFDAQDNWEDEVFEALRIAGIQLDEVNDEFHRKGEIVSDETLFRNKEEDDEQEYEEVSTSDFGKEASEGFKKPLCLESTVNVDKIKSICETAKSMYLRKQPNEWLRLDRRYVEKLMKEGCSYSRATKLIMEAKKK